MQHHLTFVKGGKLDRLPSALLFMTRQLVPDYARRDLKTFSASPVHIAVLAVSV